jgi:uncharacterized membrane protein
MSPLQPGKSVRAQRALWIVQLLLAALFLFAGVMKFVMPVEQMNEGSPVQFSRAFLYFIGVCEVLGALGLVLPGALGIQPGLTALAAAGLIVLMIGAIILPLMGGGVAAAVFPLIVAVLLAIVVRARWPALRPLNPR